MHLFIYFETALTTDLQSLAHSAVAFSPDHMSNKPLIMSPTDASAIDIVGEANNAPTLYVSQGDAIASDRLHAPSTPFQRLMQVMKLGSGLFADSYDLFVIDSVIAIITVVRDLGTDEERQMLGIDNNTKGTIAAATSAGAVIGMLVFGFMANHAGRRRLLICTAACVTIGCILCACAQASSSVTLSTQLLVFRVIIGIGIGGEYPLSAAAALEASDDSEEQMIHKMLRTAKLFSMQGAGMVTAAAIALTVIAAGCPFDASWRILIALGALPSSGALYTRIFHMRESVAFQQLTNVTHLQPPPTSPEQSPQAARDVVIKERLAGRTEGYQSTGEHQPPHNEVQQQQQQRPTLDFSAAIRVLWKQHAAVLATTSALWFLLDVTFYGTGQFRSAIEEKLFKDNGDVVSAEADARARLVRLTLFSLIVAAAGLPGYLVSALWALKRFDVWTIQLVGFSVLAVLYVIIGFLVQVDAPVVMSLITFAVTFFVTNLGPNMTTFIIPPMMYATDIRTSAHGIAAACGKIGATVGGQLLPVILHEFGLAAVMYACGGVAVVGVVISGNALKVKAVQLWRTGHHQLLS